MAWKRKRRSQVLTRVFNADKMFTWMTTIRHSNKATWKFLGTAWAWSGTHYLFVTCSGVKKTPPTSHDNEMTTDGPTGMLSHIYVSYKKLCNVLHPTSDICVLACRNTVASSLEGVFTAPLNFCVLACRNTVTSSLEGVFIAPLNFYLKTIINTY